VLSFNSCSNNVGPINHDQNEISTGSKSILIDINPDSIITEHSPAFTIDYSELRLNGISLTVINYYYPDTKLDINVDREFKIALNDSIKVEIKNCKSGYRWSPDLGSVELDKNNTWINSEVSLLRTEITTNQDSTVNYKYVFKALKNGKGYISFIEMNPSGSTSSNESHGLLVGYTIGALNKIQLNLDEVNWIYNTGQGTSSTVSVKIKGTTNVYRLRGMSYGDGLETAVEIPVQNDNKFEIEIPVAFSHVSGITLKTNSELLLYGTVGLPKVIELINPKSE
jgi:hypothetical protein